MDEILRKRLSAEEAEKYDYFDKRASIAAHCIVWPGIAGAISYFADKPGSAIVCLVIVAVAIPVLGWMSKNARRLRELAEARYGAIMGQDDISKDPPPPGDTGRIKRVDGS